VAIVLANVSSCIHYTGDRRGDRLVYSRLNALSVFSDVDIHDYDYESKHNSTTSPKTETFERSFDYKQTNKDVGAECRHDMQQSV